MGEADCTIHSNPGDRRRPPRRAGRGSSRLDTGAFFCVRGHGRCVRTCPQAAPPKIQNVLASRSRGAGVDAGHDEEMLAETAARVVVEVVVGLGARDADSLLIDERVD